MVKLPLLSHAIVLACRPLLTLFLGLAGAVRGELLPALLIEEIQVSDPQAYVTLVGQANEAMRTKHQVPLFLRAYESTTLAGAGRDRFTLSPAGTFEALLKNGRTFATDPALAALRENLKAVTQSGPATYLKAIRFDGTNTPGWLCNTLVKTTDEPALRTRVTELAALPFPPGRTKPMLNIFRVIAGHTVYTHLVSINAASSEDLAATLDLIASRRWSLVSTLPDGIRCEIVQSTVYREMLP